ncbi:MAG: ATP-binding protein [Caldilineales bacterium]|nr:ATP-binding protein [Caldilineales bacterium]MCW5859804.1 ATP-binding protein [Caldilineales bacterium]
MNTFLNTRQPVSKLPIGIQAFETMRGQGYAYVDKTRWIHRMATAGMFYFLARPRRFGKSLLLSTLKCLFEGRRELFEGLWIAEQGEWDWQSHPVILLDFNEIEHDSPPNLERGLAFSLRRIARQHRVQIDASGIVTGFTELILALHQRTRQPVVVLIDEYDKPLIDHLGKGEDGLAIARSHRDILRNFFAVLKGGTVSPALRFVLLAGVSRFSRVSIFSELNNLQDLSMNDAYADMLGYTQEEIERSFSTDMDAFADHLGWTPAEVRAGLELQYNGYRFSERDVRVYNPFSVLNALSERKFGNYWFASGTPTFLINLLRQGRWDLTAIEGLEVDPSAFSTFEIDNLRLEALLFQTGYLTIGDVSNGIYRLDYPNQEVKVSFLKSLLFAPEQGVEEQSRSMVLQLAQHLRNEDMEAFFTTMQAVFASIPYSLSAAQSEAYFHTIFYLMLSTSGADASSELLTNRGRIDLTVEFSDKVFVFEFKCNQSATAGLEQIRARGYAERYRTGGRRVMLVGINFDTTTRNIAGWEAELAS